MADLIITIDGPAASGKSTAARLLAEKLGASFLDTGAMYRAVTLAAMQAEVDMSDEDKLLGVMETSEFQFSLRDGKMVVCIDGIDVTGQIRRPQVTANARYIASSPKAREKLVQMQRRFASGRQKIVTEGRDQGTVAFSDADIKFYLTADSTERARRRQAELRAKGSDESRPSCRKASAARRPFRDCGKTGRDESLEQIQKAIEERDKSDENRTVGPLRPAEDAIVVDTTDLSIEEVVEKLLGYVKEKCLRKN
ncbi:MAG: (d)CMP kinase [Planctomycetota bacterium]